MCHPALKYPPRHPMKALLEHLPALLPLATEWVQEQEATILANGEPLSEQGLEDARTVGVIHPEKIRLLKVTSVPSPTHPLLIQAGETVGLISTHSSGLTAGYGIFIREDCWGSRRLIAHECVHCAQYERLDGIENFLTHYLRQCIEFGYLGAPLEQQALDKENRVFG